ncbi:MAG: hypothetical protein KGJ83_05575, partial [Betaproteobacteria bacterium]|nr:hypothetical protein [Betaproteobacteria bacterium]
AQNGQLIQADGGTVIMTAQAVNALLDTVVNNSGLIQARGLSQQNGRILLDGGSSGVVANGGTLDVSNARGSGGSAALLGDQVQLTATARVDASGALGGGTVLVGGNAHGAGPERNATHTSVAAGAQLNADATQSGNGGTVVAWADGSTVFDGAVSARGGALSGNGGFVETSGKSGLAVGDAATVNTLAPHGSAGNWLLDPKTITVGNTGTGTLTQAADVTNTTTALTIKASTINAATSNVTLAALQSISVNSAIAITTSGVGITFEGTNPTPTNGPSSGTTLTQNVSTTNGNVTFYGNVTLSSRSIGVTSGTANTTFNGTVNGGQALTVTSTGTTTFGSTVGNSTPLTSLTLSGATGTTVLNGNVTTTGSQSYGGSLNVNAASTLKTTNTALTVTGAATLSAATVFNTGTGALSLANTGNNLGTLNVTSAGAVTATNAGAMTISGVTASGIVNISTQSGDLTVTGTTKTTNTSSTALTLEAGSSANRVATPGTTDSNGNVVISGGSISVGSGGIGKIYTGSIANSTGLSTAVGTGHSRYWSDPGNTGYTTALTTGLNAIYREQPVVTVTASAAGSGRTYNGTTTAATFTTTGQVNGDTGSGTGTASITGTGSTLLHAGNYTVGVTGVGAGTTLAGLGYAAQAGTSSSYSIVPKNLTVTGLSVPGSKTYDGNQTATVNGTPALPAAEGAGTGSTTDGKPYSGDGIGITGTASGSYNSKDVATASTVAISGLSLTGNTYNDYALSPASFSATITPKALTGSIATGSSVYGATLDPGSVTLSGVISGDTVTPGTATVNTSGLTSSSGHLKVGTHSGIESVSGTLSGTDSGNYSFAGATGSYTVTPLGITVTATGSEKVYNGSDTASITLASNGVISGDTVSFTDTSATFADKNVGNNKTINVAGIATSGTDSGNYSLNNTSATTTANITPATLTATLTGTLTKTYDGNAHLTTALTDANYHITGFAPDEYAKINQTAATYNSKDVATASTVTASLSSANFVDGTGGFLVSNYTLPTSASGSGSITAKALTVSNTTIANKTYDGTLAATLSGGTLSGVVTGETVTLTQAGNFASKNVANGIAVTATDTLGGTDSGNYTLTQPTGLSANITPATLTAAITRFTTKTYDGTATATLTDDSYSLSGLASGESIRISQTSGTYNSKDVTSATTVTASLSSSDFVTIGTTLLSNYTLPTSASGSGSITAKALTVTGTSVANKVYDGTTAATLSGGNLVGVASGDTVTLGQAGNFASKNVANGIAVTASDTLSGTDAGNYTLAQPTGLSANITAKPITVTATGIDKTYDGTTTASVNLASSGIVGGDSVGFTSTSANFSDKNVGTNKTVTVLGIAAIGTDAGDYSLNNTSATTTANILQAALSVLSVTGTTVASKTYDGTNVATLSNGVLVGVLSGDSVSLSQSGHFTSIHAGTNIPVVATDTLGGAEAGNYTLTQPTGLSGDILAKPLTITGTVVASKVYDSTTAATLSGGSLVGVIGSDIVTLNQSGTFASKNVGTGIAVTTTDTLGGTSAGDYTLATQPAGLSGNITPAPLTVVLKGTLTKTYDGNVDVTTPLTDFNYKVTGFVGSEYAKINQKAATYNSKDVATATTVTASLSPSNFVDQTGSFLASNYTLPTSASGLGTITAKPLTVTGTVVADKVYDGTATATLSGGALAGIVSGDTVTLSQAGSFASRNVGSAIPVTAADVLGGSGSGNYTLTQPTGLSASITPATLTAAITGTITKTYDGTTAATLHDDDYLLSGLISGESISITQTSGTYNSKDVATATTVTVSLAPTDFTPVGTTLLSNYTLPPSASGSGTITAGIASLPLSPLSIIIHGSSNAGVNAEAYISALPTFQAIGALAGTSASAPALPVHIPATTGTTGAPGSLVVLVGPGGNPLLSVFNGGQKLPESD